jgi:sugar (pentulose or hexulose) kinase
MIVPVAVAALAVLLAGCAAPRPRPAPPSAGSAVPASAGTAAGAQRTAARDPRDIYVYPAQGQTPERLDRDRYECHAWAVKQSGYDPSDASEPPRRRIRVVSGPSPGEGALMGAMTGAVLGAVVSNPWHAGDGAAIGAVAGAVLGGSATASRESNARAEEQRQRSSATDERADGYRRAISACLDARGYTVR